MKIGSTNISDIKVGDTPITKVIKDGVIYWEAGIPFVDDLSAHFNQRSGSSFVDAVGAVNATILIPEFTGDGTEYLQGDKTRVQEHLFDGGNHTLYFRFKQKSALDGVSTKVIFSSGTSGRYFRISWFNQYLRLYYSDGTTTYTSNLISVLNQLQNYEYVDFLLTINGTTKVLNTYLYDTTGTQISTATRDLAAFIFNTTNNGINYTFYCSNTIVTNFKKFAEVKTVSQCKQDNYITDIQMHLPHLLSGTDISGNNLFFRRSSVITSSHIYYSSMNNWMLDYGYNDYQDGLEDTGIRVRVPYNTSGVPLVIDWSVPTLWISGFRLVGEYAGSSDSVNQVKDCKIRFTQAFFDRSNTTIWNSDARGADYDVSNPKDFHLSVLNQRKLYEWLNDGYKGRLYVHFNDNSIEKFDRKLLTNIYLYNTDKKGLDNKRILSYTGDIFAGVKDVNGAIDYDANNYVELGYLQSPSPMVTMRIDDGDVSALTGWKPAWDAYGVDAVVGIHADEVGTVGTYNYMSWAQLQTLVSEGWELADHNKTDVDYSNTEHLNSLEANMLSAKQTTLNQIGYTLKHYIGNRHSSSNASMGYYAHKVGYDAHLAWGIYGLTNAANPKMIDRYRLSAMSCDLNGNYQLEDTDNTEEISDLKTEVDFCKNENRWGIMFVHVFGTKVSNGLIEVLNYAVANDVEIVSLSTAISRLKYLPKGPVDTIIYQGTSITYGSYAVPRVTNRFTKLLSVLENSLEVNEGIGGSVLQYESTDPKSDIWYNKMDEIPTYYDYLHYKYVILEFGANDALFYPAGVAKFKTQYIEYINAWVAKGWSVDKIKLLTTYRGNIGTTWVTYNTGIQEVGVATGCQVIDTGNQLYNGGDTSTYLDDYVHPNTAGHELMANYINSQLS